MAGRAESRTQETQAVARRRVASPDANDPGEEYFDDGIDAAGLAESDRRRSEAEAALEGDNVF